MAVTLQTRFENFLGGEAAGGSPIPQLDAALGRKLLERIDRLRWHLNRYSLELNFLHGALGVDAFLSFARDSGFDGAQLHITRSGPKVGLTAESDQYLADLAEQGGTRKLELVLDISTIRREDVNDASRVARALGVDRIRCYSSSGGTIKEIIQTTIEELKYAAELGSRSNICFLFEQHERLTGSEILEILDNVGADRSIGVLFDYANPIPADRHPLEDLYEMRKVIRGAHSKDVIVLPEARGQRCIGVRFGEGDLDLPKIYFDLLMLGDDEPQLEFIAVQNVVGYLAPAGRLSDEASDRVFELKTASRTPMAPIEQEQRLARERQDVRHHLDAAKLLVNRLRSFATEAVCAANSTPELGPEAFCARAIEKIGRQLYGDSSPKKIWQALQATDGSELEGAVLAEKEARVLLGLAHEKQRELAEGCV
jgi:sugar phosphate isomerase/epimerase